MKHLILSLFLAGTLAAAKKPNIVFFLVDDLGIKDLSGEGSTYHETPRIDQLAQESIRFTNGYSTCQVCSPSRASILTGKYPPRTGITDWIGAHTGKNWKRNDKVLPSPNADKLSTKEHTLAEALADGGYATWFLGKWHIGGEGSHPEDHGFQVNIGGHHRGSPPGGFFAPFKNPKIKNDPPAGTSLPLWLADQTSELITTHQKENAEQPFLAYLSFYSVHGPIQTTPDLWKKYQQKAAANSHQGDRFLNDRTLPVRQVQDCPIYAGMMEALDQAVGRVLDTLSELQLENDTIVIFTGDNGGVTSGDNFATSALPLRGGKGRQWEGGLRAPYYLRVPGTKATHIDTPVTGTDFYPTLLDLAGLDELPEQHIDGLSLKPLLEGSKIKDRPLFWHYPHYGNQGGEPSSIIRHGDWKLIQYLEDNRLELYHLPSDIGEQRDVSKDKENAQTVTNMLATLQELQKETGALIPEKDPRFDPTKKKKQLEQTHTKKKAQLEEQHAHFLDPNFKPNKNWWGALPTD